MRDAGSDMAQHTSPKLRIRTIVPVYDFDIVLAWTRDAFVISFGEAETQRLFHRDVWLRFLDWGVSTIPEGFVLAVAGSKKKPAVARGNAVGMLLMNLRHSKEAGSLDLDENIGYIHLLYVEPAYRGRGVAEMLQQRAEDVCRREGACHVELNVEPANVRAIGFYRRVGYQLARETLREGLPVLRMRKALDVESSAPEAN